MKNKPDTNDHRLEALFGEALGTKPTPEQTEQAWQEFIQTRRASSSRRKIYTMLASAAAILVLTLILWPLLPSNKSTESIQVFASLEAPEEITFTEKNDWIEVRTPARTTTPLTLGDGTKILLSANSQLAYPKNFASDKREVHLVGEARFNVEKDANRPFIVSTEQIQTQVLGTIFDVKAYPQGTPDVTLYEGKVEVSLNGSSPLLMEPGQLATISKRGKLELAEASDNQGQWTEGVFAFENKDLMSVMQEIGSWYNISVIFHSHPLLEERIYFHMVRKSSVNEVLEVLNDLGVAKFEIKGKRIVVASR